MRYPLLTGTLESLSRFIGRDGGIAVILRKSYALSGLIFIVLTFTQGFALCCLLMPFQGINLFDFLSPERAL